MHARLEAPLGIPEEAEDKERGQFYVSLKQNDIRKTVNRDLRTSGIQQGMAYLDGYKTITLNSITVIHSNVKTIPIPSPYFYREGHPAVSALAAGG